MSRRRLRQTGKGRRTRRVIARGGSGPAEQLNEALRSWPRVRITPMFGRWGYFVGPHLFACFPLRAKDHDLWIRLEPGDQARALKRRGITPHRRFARRGWIECQVDSTETLAAALSWLRRSYETVKAAVEREERSPAQT